MNRYLILAAVLSCCLGSSAAEQAEPPQASQAMNNQRLPALIEGVAKDVEGKPGYWRFTLHDFAASVITDENADRMRIIVPVAEVKDLDESLLLRLMQANFDLALDARYSIANGILWRPLYIRCRICPTTSSSMASRRP
ncbi:MAG: hypothetical protein LJE58_08940 [Thiogranum sp.]|jgi:hypothetical protein|nr:hypothetical protein [Thiogranum sp.]